MTKLNTRLSREMIRAAAQSRPVVLTLAPGSESRDDLIGMRLKGTRTTYVARVINVYRTLALWHAGKLSAAKRAARKAGVPWRIAKRDFDKSNNI